MRMRSSFPVGLWVWPSTWCDSPSLREKVRGSIRGVDELYDGREVGVAGVGAHQGGPTDLGARIRSTPQNRAPIVGGLNPSNARVVGICLYKKPYKNQRR